MRWNICFRHSIFPFGDMFTLVDNLVFRKGLYWEAKRFVIFERKWVGFLDATVMKSPFVMLVSGAPDNWTWVMAYNRHRSAHGTHGLFFTFSFYCRSKPKGLTVWSRNNSLKIKNRHTCECEPRKSQSVDGVVRFRLKGRPIYKRIYFSWAQHMLRQRVFHFPIPFFDGHGNSTTGRSEKNNFAEATSVLVAKI